MRKPKLKFPDVVSRLKTRSFKAGGYSIAAAFIVLAIVIAVNVFFNALPSEVTKIDMTSNRVYSISDQTEKLLDNLESDISIYWIAQSGQEDSTLGTLLDRYTSLSDKIKVEKKDPDVYPTFIQNYTDTVSNNSLVVESGERYRYVDSSEIYEREYGDDYWYTGASETNFAGESAVTSAIDYVVSSTLPKAYALTGHGELELSSTFSSAVEKENIELSELSLLTVEAVPEDADCVIVYAPQSDISDKEREKLEAYLKGGGNMLLITDPPREGRLTNFEAVMSVYNVTTSEGIVVEGSQSHYAWGTPYYLLPDFGEHEITAPLMDGGYRVMLPLSQGLKIGDASGDTLSVTELLTTSGEAYSKVAGYSLKTYEKEAGDIDGPFTLAVAVSDSVDEDKTTNIVWISSASLLDEQTNIQVSGGNQDFFLNSLSWMCEPDESGISIHAKSMNYQYLTIGSGISSFITFIIVGVLPIAYLGLGIYIWARRRRR